MHLFSHLSFRSPFITCLLFLLFHSFPHLSLFPSPDSYFHHFFSTLSHDIFVTHSFFSLSHPFTLPPTSLWLKWICNLSVIYTFFLSAFLPFILLFLSYPLPYRLLQSGATLPLIIEDQRLCQRHLMVNEASRSIALASDILSPSFSLSPLFFFHSFIVSFSSFPNQMFSNWLGFPLSLAYLFHWLFRCRLSRMPLWS